MDRWTTLEPVKLHQTSEPFASAPSKATSSHAKQTHAHQNRAQFIGKLPLELHLLILHFLPILDIPRYARLNRALSRLAGDERVWDRRWRLLIGAGLNPSEPTYDKVRAEDKMALLLDELERRGAANRGRSRASVVYGQSRASSRGSIDLGSMGSPGRVKSGVYNNRTSVPQAAVLPADDDFGEFAAADLASDEFDDFVGASSPSAIPGQKATTFTPLFTPSFASPSFFPPAIPSPSAAAATGTFTTSSPSRTNFKRAYTLMYPLLRLIHASTPPHTLLSLLLPTPPPPPQAPTSPALKLIEPTQQTQAQLLATLTRFLSPSFRPTRDWEIRAHALRSAGDVFDARVLKAFEDADESGDTRAMREASWAGWEVFTAWGVPRRKDIVGRGIDVGSALRRGLGGSTARKVEWEIGKVWIERREEFYEQGKFDPLANFTSINTLSFNAMDSFMTYIINSLQKAATTSNAVFPPASCVLPLFAERLGNEIIAEYVNGLLARAREVDAEIINAKDVPKRRSGVVKTEDEWSTLGAVDQGQGQGPELYLQASAASFVVCWKVVDTLMESGDGSVERREAESIIFRIFDPHMDEYLDEEVEAVKRSFDVICREWTAKNQAHSSTNEPVSPTRTRFLTSHNPQQVKRNVVAGFTDVLMLPVTIIPRAIGTVAVGAGSLAVGAARTTGRLALGAATSTGTLAAGAARSGIAGISMLNPVKWGSSNADTTHALEGYVTPLANEDPPDTAGGGGGGGGYIKAGQGATAWVDEQEQVDWGDMDAEKAAASFPSTFSPNGALAFDTDSKISEKLTVSDTTSMTSKASSSPAPTMGKDLPALDLFLSLDVALELIHAARDSMKRLESFFPPPPPHGKSRASHPIKEEKKEGPWSATGFPGPAGRKLRETLEEIFILLLIALRERHLDPGFERAIGQMRHYKPTDTSEGKDTQQSPSAVAPLLGFFELVHIGDTIGSMIQVYFDREMSPYIDTSDFLSGIMREKKKFENALDEEVAKGLNAGTEVLMTQVEYVMWKRTTGREYCPPEGTVMAELGPTMGCKAVIECLEMHCRVVRGSTSREVLEVFYVEVGMRLHSLVQKHIKRQIISLDGGIQVIADLNAYYNFIASLKVPNLLQEFANLKMLGHVFVVDDAKDLAIIVRDVTRYGGSFRPEDVYEFVQRRSDWKKIEKEVDRTMYNLSFKEDCVIC
ncbi:hypothetical protein M408DRAFT_329894 [Serendipita vermifera MAFF 305830]|uniref:F-box domain-containing protein n=1 Tax=Serendipita vermifera MAFF 305830 TaxID=933852 RepID=A0A0C3B8E8_SERVB|nr:hypothetical protein M408DRAFT_329894 [Serendipita vermifera MAFF 305830]